jgi:hypothetical protein
VAGTSFVEALTDIRTPDLDRGTAPLRQIRDRIRASKIGRTAAPKTNVSPATLNISIPRSTSAATRQSAQLPAFAPLLEELEVAGWSSHRRTLSGNFHDWSLPDGRTLLAVAGHAVASQADGEVDAIEAALVAQGAWVSIRSHAHHATDAGALLSLAARSLWPITNADLQAAVAIALVDLDGGHASVAIAGDCLALRVKAAETEQIATAQPMLGVDANFNYVSHSLHLSLRERILLVADEPQMRPAKLATQIVSSFSRLDAEAHRRMMAADAITIVRQSYEPQTEETARTSASIVAVRRR